MCFDEIFVYVEMVNADDEMTNSKVKIVYGIDAITDLELILKEDL